MFTIDDYRWLGTPDALEAWTLLLEIAHEDRANQSLGVAKDAGRRFSPSQWRLLHEQHSFAKLAASKFPDPSNWRWTRILLEQSSDHWCAQETALDFPAGIAVVDVCCGAGADSIALNCDRSVTSVDLDPVAVQLTKLNSSLHQCSLDVQCKDANELDLPGDAYLHIDPDRRQGRGRVTSLDGFQPVWETIHRLKDSAKGCSMKVAPATVMPDAIARPDTIRFLSRDRSVRQQRWLWGLSRWPSKSFVLSACTRGQWHHETYPYRESSVDLWGGISSELGPWIGDYDPVVRAAKLSLVFAASIGCQVLQQEGGYLVSQSANVHPFVKWYRVLEVLPQDRKKLIAYARSHPCRLWTLKSRGVEVDLDAWRKALPTSAESDEVRTILFTKIGPRQRAVVAMERDV